MMTRSIKTLAAALAFGVGLTMMPIDDAEARRMGGARSSGMQRSAPEPAKAPPTSTQNATPNATTPPTTAAAPAGATAAAAAPAAAAAKRSWMGPVAGIAAGLGIAALFSAMGWGEGLANVVTMLLLAMAVLFVVRLVLRSFGSRNAQHNTPAMAGAGAGAGAGGSTMARTPWAEAPPSRGVSTPSGVTPHVAAAAPTQAAIPADFDAAGFERLARTLFVRMQEANDRGDLEDLRRFTTPELFAELRVDLQDRQGKPQQTDVVQVDAKLVEVAQDAGQQIVSVRFNGLIREAREDAAAPFDEVWHLVQPIDGGDGGWRIAGIQQQG